ncbi:tRNA 2-selenouridine(34) synthase MnmH [Shewanella yunxiaonensis]|uniref:tRNA 2-selenouridine synthase n=1 Tax=Shewanella yunxiaonensis TaxID=2829809 RepID=A0ABX7YVB4_9GAMM|nr:tRNA 2-selenouridine(34) synthase MnmH [Shewanella yunxiaonensis]QUN06056.1 tRNA 2-selenouridine(34) synthase MnmH [Shewanella yunxiaonensis]
MAQNVIPASEYRAIFLSKRPLIDLRAPVEFTKGAFASSHNLPLMTDDERQQVGTCYKQHGPTAALALGHQLVQGAVKAARVDAWLAFCQQHPDAYFYCFRGGMRSQISQSWLQEAGRDIPYIAGGYKGMRQFLIQTIEDPALAPQMLILSGITGSGKTEVIHQRTEEAVDLEGVANHRGSSFGKEVTPQPTQINFENNLALALLQHQQRRTSCLLLEDESHLVGRCFISKPFFDGMQAANVIVLEASLQDRLQRLLAQYVHKMHHDFCVRDGEEMGFESFSQYLRQSVNGISRRLGQQHATELLALIERALQEQQQRNNTELHLEWIALLLGKYYDPMYEYQLQKKADRIVFRGDQRAINQWLDEQTPR